MPIKPFDIKLKSNAVPYQTPLRQVLIALQENFKDENKSMEKQGIISKLDHNMPTEWLNSYVIVKKPNGSPHICLDPTRLNEYILRPVFNSTTVEEVSHKLAGAKFFSMFDAAKGFFHLPLSEESKLLTAMLMPDSVYVFNVLAMGLCNSGDLFESVLNQLLSHLTGITRIANDILVYCTTQEEHDYNVIAVHDTCLQIDLKMRINCTEIPFFGMLLMKDGIKPDPKKVKEIKNWLVPQGIKQLQSFLASVTWLSHFIPDLAKLCKPLQQLTKKGIPFMWMPIHTEAFETY